MDKVTIDKKPSLLEVKMKIIEGNPGEPIVHECVFFTKKSKKVTITIIEDARKVNVITRIDSPSNNVKVNVNTFPTASAGKKYISRLFEGIQFKFGDLTEWRKGEAKSE